MCRPLIASDGYDGLVMTCKEHGTTVPVLNKEGLQAYAVDVLQFTDMLIEHRKEVNDRDRASSESGTDEAEPHS